REHLVHVEQVDLSVDDLTGADHLCVARSREDFLRNRESGHWATYLIPGAAHNAGSPRDEIPLTPARECRDQGYMRASVSSGVTPRLFRSAAFAMLCVIWGSTWLAIRIGLQGAPPFLAATLRFLLASITLAVLAIVFRSKWPANRTEWALVAFVGLVLFTADY